jgi:multicomponent Na+:H+ antiporter subunit C
MKEALVFLVSSANYWDFIALMMIGLYAIIAKKNCVKKIIGMNIMQTAIILFFISAGAKNNATLPIILHGNEQGHPLTTATQYINPLPHVLMLTAIVVAVATLGVALALVIRIHRQYRTLEENEILKEQP